MSVALWRIAQETRDYRADDMSGAGAAKVGGRWNSPGKAMVYTASSAALAYLESLAHLGREAPRNRFLIRVEVPKAIWKKAARVTEKELPKIWRADPVGMSSMQFGDKWLDAGQAALLCIPSVIVPEDINVLINPEHPDAEFAQAHIARQLLFDPRVLQL